MPPPPPDAEKYLPLVRHLAVRVRGELGGHVELEDLVGYGATGLLEALSRFEPERGLEFSTFAYHRIRGAIYDGLRTMGRLPRAMYARVKAAESARAYLEAQEASGEESDIATLRELHAAMAGAAFCMITSLDAMEGELADPETDVESTALVASVAQRMRAAIASLPEEERHLIEQHYGADRTLHAAGADLGMSRSWACRLHARAIDRLRFALGQGEESYS